MDINSFVLGYKKGKASGGGGGGSLEGFHMVRFFNDDQTTLLYTVFVPTGADVIYAGETPVSTIDKEYIFSGFEPAATNITTDLDCYAVYGSFTSLNDATWNKIAQLSAEGTAQNYFAVGDTKMIRVSGQIGNVFVNSDYGVYIIGFDHNEELEGKGIHFGTFKSSESFGYSLCFTEGSNYNNAFDDGVKRFNMSHWGDTSYAGWAGCDMRYDILGSTDVAPSGYGAEAVSGRVGYDPTTTCATNPVEKTLMAALPADLRAVMKPMIKYTNNVGDGIVDAGKITATTDYLPLLAAFEVVGAVGHTDANEQYKQKRYDYYTQTKNSIKYSQLDESLKAWWWTRSPRGNGAGMFCSIANSGYSSSSFYADKSLGIAPIFKV